MKIYTKTGDDGTTGLFGGERVPKFSARIEAYGTVDELNSVIGIVLTGEMPERLRESLTRISSLLFDVGADLATPLNPPPKYAIPRIQAVSLAWLEGLIDEFEAELSPLKNFILPGGTFAAAHLHLARTVCRRAERKAVELQQTEYIGEIVVPFLNRLSDFLFVSARFANSKAGIEDVAWKAS